jgi:hypothetical protein
MAAASLLGKTACEGYGEKSLQVPPTLSVLEIETSAQRAGAGDHHGTADERQTAVGTPTPGPDAREPAPRLRAWWRIAARRSLSRCEPRPRSPCRGAPASPPRSGPRSTQADRAPAPLEPRPGTGELSSQGPQLGALRHAFPGREPASKLLARDNGPGLARIVRQESLHLNPYRPAIIKPLLVPVRPGGNRDEAGIVDTAMPERGVRVLGPTVHVARRRIREHASGRAREARSSSRSSPWPHGAATARGPPARSQRSTLASGASQRRPRFAAPGMSPRLQAA